VDVPATTPIESARPIREADLRQQTQNTRGSQGLIENRLEQPSETPDSGGVLASSQSEGGVLRDPTAARDTKDQNSIAEVIRRITNDIGQPGSTRLAIEIDAETNEPRFLILSKETGEVLRQVPSQDILPMLRELTRSQGALVDRRV
jgi:uncharacterized FlaG/YvyC family protein